MKTISIFLLGLLCSCGIYTFSGSTLPAHLKTVEIPLFFNESLQSGIAEDITDKLSQRILSSNLLRVVSSNGDAVIQGKVMRYSNSPYTYGASGERRVDVSEYAVKINVKVEFLDQKNEEPLYEGTITGTGVYDFNSQTEEVGKSKAILEIVDQIIQNSVQSW